MNSASRISALVANLHMHANQNTLVNVWAEALGISEENQNKKAVKVMDSLSVIHRELSIFKEDLERSVFTTDVYAPLLERLELAFSPLILNSTWSSAHGHLGGDTISALQIFGQALPKEETSITPEELESILKETEALEKMLTSSELPERLVALIRHHIKMIRDAIAEYQIAGATALRTAFHTAIGELVENKEIIKENSNDKAVTKLKSVWEKIDKTTDTALKVAGAIELGNQVVSYLKDFFS